jgi:DNA-binding Lrp family transcriptional regulator
MTKDIFKDRERSEEERFIRDRDAKLIEKMREKARLDEIVKALAESLQVSDPALLDRVRELGITLER